MTFDQTAKRVVMKQGEIVLIVDDFGWEYEIDFDRIRTPEEILSWVHRLCEKNWFTSSMQREFIEVAMRRIGKTAWPVPA